MAESGADEGLVVKGRTLVGCWSGSTGEPRQAAGVAKRVESTGQSFPTRSSTFNARVRVTQALKNESKGPRKTHSDSPPRRLLLEPLFVLFKVDRVGDEDCALVRVDSPTSLEGCGGWGRSRTSSVGEELVFELRIAIQGRLRSESWWWRELSDGGQG